MKKPGLFSIWWTFHGNPQRVFLFLCCLLLNLAACSPVDSTAELPVEQPAEPTPIVITATIHVGDLTPIISSPTAIIPTPSLPPATSTPDYPATPACLFEKGRYEFGSLSSELLPQPLEYRVYLPPCYDQYPGQSYPVLYLVHGRGFDDDQWDRLGVDESADKLIAAGEIPPFLIVLPGDRSGRRPENDMFGQVLVMELVPHIDSVYRTLSQRPYRAIGGLSRGAAWAVRLGLLHWQEFGTIGAHSLLLFFGDEPRIRTWLDTIPAESVPRIYLDIGEKEHPDILESALWFENLLIEKGIPHEWHLFSGYHVESYWQSHVEQYLRWYAREW